MRQPRHPSNLDKALKAMRVPGSRWKRTAWAGDAFIQIVDGRVQLVVDGVSGDYRFSSADAVTRDWLPVRPSAASVLFTFAASDFFTFDSTTARRWVEGASRDRVEWLQQHVEKYIRGGWRASDIWIEEHPESRTILFIGGHMRAEWVPRAERRAA